MNDTDIIAPFWKYTSDDATERSLSEIHVLIWPGGLATAGFTAEGTPVWAETYITRDQPGAIWLQHLLSQQPILKSQSKKVKKIWLSEERNLLIPNSLYENDFAESWIRKFHYLEPEEMLLHFDLSESVDARIVFPVSEALKLSLNDNFPNASLMPLSQMVFPHPDRSANETIRMISLPREIIFSLNHNGHYIFHLTFPYDTPQNVIYKLALVLEEKGISPEQITRFSITGIAPFWNNVLEELARFFSIETPGDNTTEITLNFLKTLYSCV
ncbi:MAG TPA: DUF3822 family protein [Edaphocola sp.]|nr:DUF3822 family protein [Edaphocola sp.]